MIHGFYLVDKRRANVDEEVRLFRQAMGVDVDPLHFEDIVPIVGPGDDDGILMTSGERLPRPDFVFTRAFRLTDEESYQMKAVLRMLEGMGVLCINPAECKDITADKLRTFQVARAVIPEIPVSISSKISVGVSSSSARTVFTASMTRDSSPPDATFPIGFRGSPGFAEK